MKNKFTDYKNGVIAIESLNGFNILINSKRLNLVDQATNDYWKITKENNQYYAFIKQDNCFLYMHDIITGKNNWQCEERFIKGNNSSLIVLNPYFNRDSYINRPIINNGLCNLDDNLIITSDKVDNEIYPLNFNNEEIYQNSYLELLMSNVSDKDQKILEFKNYLEQILRNPLIRRTHYLDEYNELLKMINSQNLNAYLLERCSKSIMELEEKFCEINHNFESTYLFPGHIVLMWSSIKELKALKMHICNFSGALIYPGSYYLSYRLFLENLTTKTAYCLRKPIELEAGYESILPETLAQLDSFAYNLEHAYELGLDEYYTLATNLKTDTVPLIKINKKR